MNAANTETSATADTNVIVSGALFEGSLPDRFLDALRDGMFALVLSDLLRREYLEVRTRPRFARRYALTPKRVTEILALIAARARLVAPVPHLPVAVRDPKDAMVLATALGGGADYLVTGDADLLVLRAQPALAPLRIVTVREFLDALPR